MCYIHHESSVCGHSTLVVRHICPSYYRYGRLFHGAELDHNRRRCRYLREEETVVFVVCRDCFSLENGRTRPSLGIGSLRKRMVPQDHIGLVESRLRRIKRTVREFIDDVQRTASNIVQDESFARALPVVERGVKLVQ